jgi:glycolate oxidase FAD binding subunit
VPVIEVSSDDQFLIVTGDTPLLEVYAALPNGLFPPFPPVALPGGVAGLVTRGGFAQRFFFASEILGAVIRSPQGQVVRAGGRTVKNVQGYDLVRPLVGSFGTLGTVLEVTFRLRPGRASSLQVRAGSLGEVPTGAQFAWQDGLNVYAMQFGAPRVVEKMLEQFAGQTVSQLDYLERFPNGLGVQTKPDETGLIDTRFTWVDGPSVPEMPAIFSRLARAI